MRKGSITAFYETPGGSEIETIINFTFTPGYPQTGPSYDSGGEPAQPPEVEFDSVETLSADSKWETNSSLSEWAIAYLASDKGFEAACSAFENQA